MSMDQDGIPPDISEVSGAQPEQVSRPRWWLHLCVLAIFPLLPGVMGIVNRDAQQTLLPKTVGGLLKVSVFELLFFGFFFVLAWLASRVSASQLLLRWKGGGLPLVFGFAYSVLLRMIIVFILIAIAVVYLAATRMHPGDLEKMRPQIDHVVNAGALTQSPLYFALCLTLISFVVAAFREELWRAAMLAGVKALFPKQFASFRGKAIGVVMVAVLFGLGHTSQGIAGVAVTGLLGIGLGAIMLVHGSIWEAVIAHGFFDASTFAVLYFIAKYFPGKVPGL